MVSIGRSGLKSEIGLCVETRVLDWVWTMVRRGMRLH